MSGGELQILSLDKVISRLRAALPRGAKYLTPDVFVRSIAGVPIKHGPYFGSDRPSPPNYGLSPRRNGHL
jgi:hypothetical protein